MDPITHPARVSTASGLTTLCTVLALALAVSSSVLADEVPGNTISPGGQPQVDTEDSRGITLLQSARRRTPSGLLYPYPPAAQKWKPLAGNWNYQLSGRIGAIWDGGDEEESRFERFAEWTDEGLLSGLALNLSQDETGDWLELRAGSAGRDDAFYSFDGGRAGVFHLRGSFSRTPHRYMSDANVLFDGVGSTRLSLPAGLTPGVDNSALIPAALVAQGNSTLEILRDKSRVSARWDAHPLLNFSFAYGFEDRRGERPFGTAFSFPELTAAIGGVVEVAEPVKDRVQDVSLGAHFQGERVQANVSYAGSFYRNRNDALVMENPFDVGGVPIAEARFALAPDNDSHTLRGEVAVSTPLDGRWRTTLAWSTMRQEEELLPPTINGNLIGAIDLADWNSSAALSQRDADARIDTLLLDTTLELRPIRALRLRARYRYDDHDNKTSYIAFNPATGEFGYIVEDGSPAAVFGSEFSGVIGPGPGGDFPVRSADYDRLKQRYELGLNYRLGKKTRFELRYEGEQTKRDARERERTVEDRVRASWSTRAGSSTLRLSYEFATRDAGSHNPNYRTPVLSSGLPGFVPLLPEPAGLAQLRRPALADRKHQVAQVRWNCLIGNSIDLAIATRYENSDQRADYGLEDSSNLNANFDLSYQHGPNERVYVFASWDRRRRDMANINAVPSGATNPNAGGTVYPLTSKWDAVSEDSTLAAGAGWSWHLNPAIVASGEYRFTSTRGQLGYDFATAGALADPGVPAGTRLPRLDSTEHLIETRLRWSVREDISLVLFHRLQHWQLDDWAQSGLVPLNGNRLFFAHIDRDFAASLYGAFVDLRF